MICQQRYIQIELNIGIKMEKYIEMMIYQQKYIQVETNYGIKMD
jgi:hypothetical protein